MRATFSVLKGVGGVVGGDGEGMEGDFQVLKKSCMVSRLRQVKYSETITDLALDITWGITEFERHLSLLQPISCKCPRGRCL